jgi:hypothetical protein
MSYGVWSNHGKGYAVLEVDTPGGANGDYSLGEYREQCEYRGKMGGYYFLIRGLDKYGVAYDLKSDLSMLRWVLGQKRRNPNRKHFDFRPGGGEHVKYVAYEDRDALDRAVVKGHISPEDVTANWDWWRNTLIGEQ